MKMTQALYRETAAFEARLLRTDKRRLNVSGILKLLGVSRSGFRAYKHRKPSKQELRRLAVRKQIREIYNDSHQNYGAPKITQKLRQNGEIISEKTVGNYMKEMGLKAQYIRPYTKTTMDPDFSSKLKNVLNEQFNPDKPDSVWVSDITYIWTFTGFVYLISIMDLYSRKIISWILSDTLEAKWVVKAVEQAKQRRKNEDPLVLHSDRGVQYVSAEYINSWNCQEKCSR